jgi:PTS system mannose-specific IIA component
MIKTILLSHGPLAAELVAAARTIAGDLPDIEALSLDWREGLDEAVARLGRAMAAHPDAKGFLLLTDLYGSTPTNAALRYLSPGTVEVITGVNLPMVVRLGCARQNTSDLAGLARVLREKGQRAICMASDELAARAAGCSPDTGTFTLPVPVGARSER